MYEERLFKPAAREGRPETDYEVMQEIFRARGVWAEVDVLENDGRCITVNKAEFYFDRDGKLFNVEVGE